MARSTHQPAGVSRPLTVAEVARHYGVDAGKVLGWVRSKQLPAINIAARSSGRPRWRIRQQDLDRFETSRLSAGTPDDQPHKSRVRRTPAPTSGVIQFF